MLARMEITDKERYGAYSGGRWFSTAPIGGWLRVGESEGIVALDRRIGYHPGREFDATAAGSRTGRRLLGADMIWSPTKLENCPYVGA